MSGTTIRTGLTATERQRAARLPVALPVMPPVHPGTGLVRVTQALAALGISRPVGTDDDLLAAYVELRERTGMHPADVWMASQDQQEAIA